MCGIAGAAWTEEGSPLDRETLDRMAGVLAHRGPDDSGGWLSPPSGCGAALGFRRLSIIDLTGGHQPLANEDETVWIVFNGEIYNYRELRDSLISRGHRFRTSTDTEVIVHLYEEHGPECVTRLRGMFAFGLWDGPRRQLLLARDRLGKKPLVYRLESNRLLFASELKALLQVPGIAREIDPLALDEYLTYQYVPHPHCILKGFQKLPPAHWAVYRGGRLDLHRYWKPGFDSPRSVDPSSTADRVQARQELREKLTEAVRLRLRSDVPLGAFLSGGVDSTIIAGLMQEQSGQTIKTFSIGFPVRQFDERSFAQLAAEHLKTEHHVEVVEPSAVSILPKLVWHYDEPFADSSAIPMLYLAEMTRKHVTVALSGDGGDELFAGYERYQAVHLTRWIDRLPRFVRKGLAAPVWQRIPGSVRQKSFTRRLKRFVSALDQSPERRYITWVSIFDATRRQQLYSPELREQLQNSDSADFLLQAYADCPERDFVTRTTCADVLTYLPGDILTKVDVATMAHSLEARCPFLDHLVVEFAASLPIEWKLERGRGKRILIETFADLIPPAIQNRAKMGFGVPLDHWLRNDLRDWLREILLDPQCLNRGLFDPKAVARLVNEHLGGQWDHSYRLWSLLVLELWQRTWLSPQPTSSS